MTAALVSWAQCQATMFPFLSLTFILIASQEQDQLPQLQKACWQSRHKGKERGSARWNSLLYQGCKTFPETPIRLLHLCLIDWDPIVW